MDGHAILELGIGAESEAESILPPVSHQVIAGLVLAAGDSTRMGTSKTWLEVAGVPFAIAVITKLRAAGVERIAVAIPRNEPKITGIIELGVAAIAVPDDVRVSGPIGSIRTWLRSDINQMVDNLVVWPVDQPHVLTATVKSLLLGLERRTTMAIAIPQFNGKRGHPVVFRSSVFPELLQPEADGGAKAVVRKDPARVLEIEVDDQAVIQDIDTPADYAALISSTKSLL